MDRQKAQLERNAKRQMEDEPSVWSTGLVFATLILLTALMFVLAKKVATSTAPAPEAVIEIRAQHR